LIAAEIFCNYLVQKTNAPQKGEKMNRITKYALITAIFGLPTIASADGHWTGFYLGANIAYTNLEFSAGGLSANDSAPAYGLHAGYNYVMPSNLVIGGELSYGTANYTIDGGSGDLDTTRLKGKLGYDLERALVYGILGYARLDDGNSVSESGITYGIGVNFMPSDSTIVSIELLRDSFDISGVNVDATSLNLGLSYKF